MIAILNRHGAITAQM